MSDGPVCSYLRDGYCTEPAVALVVSGGTPYMLRLRRYEEPLCAEHATDWIAGVGTSLVLNHGLGFTVRPVVWAEDRKGNA